MVAVSLPTPTTPRPRRVEMGESEMSSTTLTNEDYAILWNGVEARTNMVLAMTADDARDAELMRGYEFAKANEREWREEMAANADMRRREGAWEDAGCRS